ncbi:ammonia channel protein [Methanobrevibacter arboriphilus]|jgi:Amt family ammonium transporter|uniref:Ammonia channel protein n=1 Tax=Methanobrevibacter arboriphilus TaxID=39441 RepID=A0ACA8R140_METAZ|nr:ammonium transporter [Methanobrevibacter arboriphilus]MCC7562509.1 ammonium transporter [Methanobrevibacter arboriphilus]BBL61235.1 ammonia channel protein [Methanobrevibacter arboriphilus]GLI11432.1 ammonia channel protein [Methanobrevibacter arboriphilus]
MVDILNTGDTAWILISTVLVLLMSIPGIAFFYGGLAKKKNVLNTMFLTLIAFAIVSIIWVIYGYQFAFGADINGLIGYPANLLMSGIGINDVSGSIPSILFVAFQLTFAGLTAALISGAVIGRMKFSAWIAFIVVWISAVYIPIAHWVWGGGWLMQMGALDFAGGTVVHISSGISALALVLILKSRKNKTLLPHNLGYSVLGAAFLWFGWMGFNGGSALTAGGLAASALLVSNIAAAVALVTWVCIDTIKEGKPTVLGAISGAIAGLVAITPAAGFVDVSGAIVIGIGASIVSYFAITYLKPRLGYDDALDVFGIHGMSGIWGAIATGIFAAPFINEAAGLLYGNPGQITIQIIAVIATIIYAFVVTIIIAKIIDLTMGLRVKEKDEVEGLDTNLHEESGYML